MDHTKRKQRSLSMEAGVIKILDKLKEKEHISASKMINDILKKHLRRNFKEYYYGIYEK